MATDPIQITIPPSQGSGVSVRPEESTSTEVAATDPHSGQRGTPSPIMPGAYTSPSHANARAGPSSSPTRADTTASSSSPISHLTVQPLPSQNSDISVNGDYLPTTTTDSPGAQAITSNLDPIITTAATLPTDGNTSSGDTRNLVPPERRRRGRASRSRRPRSGVRGRAALEGIERFRKSWAYVNILKAVIAMAQVTALFVLLILASTLPSPIYPSLKQSQPSEACPRPRLFQAWMGVQISRLTICLSLSIWVFLTKRKAERARSADQAQPEAGVQEGAARAAVFGGQGGSSEHPTPNAGALDGVPNQPQQPSVNVSSASLMSSTDTFATAPGTSTPSSQAVPELPPAPDPSRTSILPTAAQPLAFSDSPALFAVPACPRASTSDLNSALAGLTDSVAPAHTSPQASSTVSHPELLHSSIAERTISAHAAPLAGQNTGQQATHRGGAVRRSQARSARDQSTTDALAAFEQAELAAVASAGWARTVRKWLNVIGLVLFILGNILVFKPIPSSTRVEPTCYNASPMLWWGVMSVTAVGWVLAAQLLIWAVVGILLSITRALLRRAGVLPPLPQPEPGRPSRPAPLTKAELNKLGYVIYLPEDQARTNAPTNAPTNASTAQLSSPRRSTTITAAAKTRTRYELTDQEAKLSHPAVRLAESQATCGICQEDYVPPERGREGSAELLRKLGCGHIYHATCIDQWLTKQAGNCPFCNRSVKEMLQQANKKKEEV
ncbi:hypothetical protein IAU59_007315 [Kwoniella sp. CBS 9459]